MIEVNEFAQAIDRCRTCFLCGHVHAYETPIYRCEWCFVWGQDFYELRPTSLATRFWNWIGVKSK